MNGCVLFLLLQLMMVELKNPILVDIDDIAVYAKPGDAMQLSKIGEDDNEDLKINCGKTRRQWLSTPFRISAGSAAKLGQFPWAVALTFLNNYQYNYCGGSIISKRHILTAAHCIMEHEDDSLPCTNARTLSNPFDLIVRYGGICLRSDSPPCVGKECSIAKIRKFAIFRRFMDENCLNGHDFAIVELETDLMFDMTTSAICLPSANFNLSSAGNLFDYGFGHNEKEEKVSRLNYGSAKIIGVSKYRDYIQVGPFYVPTNHTGPLHGICTGDSGAGLEGFVKNRAYLLGIHSFGPKKCHNGSPFTVTDLRPYADLICKLTGVCYHL